MSLVVNREALRKCSTMLQDVLELKQISVEHDPASVVAVGKQVLGIVLPQLEYMYKRPTEIAADMALLRVGDGLRRFDEATFVGNFTGIRVADLVELEHDEDFGDLQTQQVDILFAFTPEFREPEPVDLVFGTEIIVPVSRMAKIGKAA